MIAHARALHAVHPIMQLGTPRHRDVIYRSLAREFQDLEASVEDLLRHSELARGRRDRTRQETAGATAEESVHGRPGAGKEQ